LGARGSYIVSPGTLSISLTFFLLSQDGDSDEGWGSDVSSDDGQGVVFVPEPDVDPFAPPAPPAADAHESGGMQGSGREANKEEEGEEEEEDEVKRLAAEAERMEREAKHCMRYTSKLSIPQASKSSCA